MTMQLCFLVMVLASLLVAGCEPGTDVVGSDQDQPIAGLTFAIDTTFVDGSGSGTLVARGRATFNGSGRVSSPWTVEGVFYTDGTFRTALGGSSQQIGVPLTPGQGTLWTLRFTSSTIDVRQYSTFRVNNLRGVYK